MTYMLVKKEAQPCRWETGLKALRAAKGLNQQGLGALVGASRQTISLIERGDYNPSITLALRIAKVFGAAVEDVFYLTDTEEETV